MAAFRRVCSVAVLILGVGLLASVYTTPPEELSAKAAAVQVKIQAFSESMAHTFAEHSAVARALSNSTMLALRERLVEAHAEGKVLRASLAGACGEYASTTWVKAQALSTSAFDMGSEHAALAKMHLQGFAADVVERFLEYREVISKYIEDVQFAEMPGKLYVLSLDGLQRCKATAYAFIDRLPTDIRLLSQANFKVACYTAMAYLREFSKTATHLQLAGGAILAFVVMISFTRLVRAICCRRRVVAAGAGSPAMLRNDAQHEIAMAPAPLRERFASVPQTRRRRSESPGFVAKENATAAQDNSSTQAQEVLAHLNTASSDELKTMAGLGEKSINQIIQYRRKSGDLQSIDDLTNKVGLRATTFANFAKAQGI